MIQRHSMENQRCFMESESKQLGGRLLGSIAASQAHALTLLASLLYTKKYPVARKGCPTAPRIWLLSSRAAPEHSSLGHRCSMSSFWTRAASGRNVSEARKSSLGWYHTFATTSPSSSSSTASCPFSIFLALALLSAFFRSLSLPSFFPTGTKAPPPLSWPPFS